MNASGDEEQHWRSYVLVSIFRHLWADPGNEARQAGRRGRDVDVDGQHEIQEYSLVVLDEPYGGEVAPAGRVTAVST